MIPDFAALAAMAIYLGHQGRPPRRRNKPPTCRTRRMKTWGKRMNRPVEVVVA
jgi:hypothetical protein